MHEPCASELSLKPAAALAAGMPSTRLDRSALSWALYQGCRDPYLGLVNGFIFMPYFATVLVANPVQGQTLAALIGKIIGIIVAVAAPLLGGVVDRIGPRKPWLLGVTLLMAPLIGALWFAAPGDAGLPLSAVCIILIAIGVLIACGDVLFSSMLASAAPAEARSLASGVALSLGNVISFILLTLILWAFVLPGQFQTSWLPTTPLLGLSPATHEPDRIVAPLVAITFLVGAIPLFVFAKDAQRGDDGPFWSKVKEGVHGLIALVRSAREYRNVTIYILARTASQDAGTVLLLLGGVYAAGVMQWGAMEMLTYGLIGTVAGMFGGLAAGRLDNRFGPRRALQIEIAGSLLGLLAILGTSRSQILWLWPYDSTTHAAVWHGPMFTTLPELCFLLFAFCGFIFQIAAWSSSRTLLTRLAPPSKLGSFFGLAALTAAATGWIGPLLAGWFTDLFHSQQAGFFPVAALLVVGLIALFFVDDRRGA
jgi:UMF1 family MFS transporter